MSDYDNAPFYCDQCGARYTGPGQCAKQHPATDLKPTSEIEQPPETAPLPPPEPVYGHPDA